MGDIILPGRRLHLKHGLYTIDGMLGFGLHSKVYSARDTDSNRSIALKIIDLEHQNVTVRASTISRRQSFQKELQYLLRLQRVNPYIVRIYDYDIQNSGVIAMEQGTPLRYFLPKYPTPPGAQLTPQSVHRFWCQLVDGVRFLHRARIVHSDLKPENLIVLPDGQIRIIDLGMMMRKKNSSFSNSSNLFQVSHLHYLGWFIRNDVYGLVHLIIVHRKCINQCQDFRQNMVTKVTYGHWAYFCTKWRLAFDHYLH